MKKLYALLIILIVIYVGVNLGSNAFHSQHTEEVTNDTLLAIGESSFVKISNFTDTKVNDTMVSLADEKNGIVINISEIDDSQNIEDIVYNAVANVGYTSNQTIDQNGVTTYFLYNEDVYSYNADIYFNKNGKNYLISGADIPYENSDYFINTCKGIIDSLNVTSSD
ncbi:hypothetical protein TL18_05225 [Methanobrevibacter sp. YE315]|uniref:hypothetical protein n=1 Tax=Methanobrevibacter sp. YE315 TaxID=1609968 RepID=UPI000764EE4C|nr:hypothetical protein [Methanobrevibacter sp. YE315]AMD17471.1 hypothetical protein TL18_05225 [Methanobrevibacter sp. YE315]